MTASIAPVSQRRELGALLRGVVKVLCVADAPDYEQPWQRLGPSHNTGSGSIVQTDGGPRVLTSAHCVANHVFVEVRRYGDAGKYEAEVEALSHECDLALLRVCDEAFFASTAPIPIGALPRLSDRVSVCGYPIGGERLSITEGIVSRIDLVAYAQSNRELLAVQLDASINPGGSGGPVLKHGKLVGVAFQALDEAEQIGYMVAPPIVEHFLHDVRAGVVSAFPSLGVTVQKLESRVHRRALGLPERGSRGVLVCRVAYGGSAHGVLSPGDVLLSIDGVNVASDGTVPLRTGELVSFSHIVANHHAGDRVRATVWRAAQELDCVLELKPSVALVAEARYDVAPRYFIAGGLLFVPLTRDYLSTWGDAWWQTAPRELVALYESGAPTAACTEPVVLQKVLAHRVNQGYHDIDNVLVEAVDGKPVGSLAQLIELVEADRDSEYLRFTLDGGQQVVLDRQQARERNKHILRKYGVRHDRSTALRAMTASG